MCISPWPTNLPPGPFVPTQCLGLTSYSTASERVWQENTHGIKQQPVDLAIPLLGIYLFPQTQKQYKNICANICLSVYLSIYLSSHPNQSSCWVDWELSRAQWAGIWFTGQQPPTHPKAKVPSAPCCTEREYLWPEAWWPMSSSLLCKRLTSCYFFTWTRNNPFSHWIFLFDLSVLFFFQHPLPLTKFFTGRWCLIRTTENWIWKESSEMKSALYLFSDADFTFPTWFWLVLPDKVCWLFGEKWRISWDKNTKDAPGRIHLWRRTNSQFEVILVPERQSYPLRFLI